MKTEPVYLYDSYLRELDAEIIEVLPEGVVTDRTIFYPGGGGQIFDTGWIVASDVVYDVVGASKVDDKIVHMVKGHGLRIGDKVALRIDWNRRYKIMRMHTSLHIIGAIMYKNYGVLISGSNIEPDVARIDFPMEEMSRELASFIVGKANSLAKEGREVRAYFITIEEALKRRDLFRLYDISKYEKYLQEKVRVVEIAGLDLELDGGTHVRNTREIGEIVFLKYESKGKRNRRLYITVSP